MPTLLVTRKMSPALAARIEASLRGDRASGATFGPRLVALFRLVALLGILGATGSLVAMRHRVSTELEQSRSAVLAAVRAHRASLAPEDLGAVARAEAWLVRLSGPYEGDVVDPGARSAESLGELLAQPSLYVRGPLEAFRTSSGIARAAAASFKDAFLLCLLEPPPDRSERAALTKVHVAYGGGSRMDQRTANAHRLHSAEVGLPLLAPAWAERVSAAKEGAELERLRKELAAAPLEEAKRAAAARVLVVALDEPGEAGGLSELDGERPHDVRVGIVDLRAGKIMLRLRKRVDPSWITLQKRADYASGLDACALALDVRARAAPP